MTDIVNLHILLANGKIIDLWQAQQRSAKFAVAVTGWIYDVMQHRGQPSAEHVRQQMQSFFPGSRILEPDDEQSTVTGEIR